MARYSRRSRSRGRRRGGTRKQRYITIPRGGIRL